MTDNSSKNVKNPLFNAAVTGTTLEEFSQNALLLPAMEKPPPPVINISRESILNDNQQSPAILHPVEDNLHCDQNTPVSPAEYFQQDNYQPVETLQSNFIQPQNTVSNLGSVFSSFSNILKINSNTTPLPEVAVPLPAGIDNLISQGDPNAPPVPLFPSIRPVEPPKPPTSQDTANSFRRGGLKRPAYAPVPGLTTARQQPALFSPPQQSSVANYFNPPPSASPINSITPTSSAQDHQQNFNLPNQFKPISPFPPNPSNVAPQVPQPQISGTYTFPSSSSYFQPIQQPNLFTPLSGSIPSGPVMSDIPASEALQNNIPRGDVGSTSNTAGNLASSNQTYRPVYHHWFYNKEVEGKPIWNPFSMVDSLALEHAFTSSDLDPDKVVSTDGGRFDVNILRRQRTPVYWSGNPTEVRRCSWFFKTSADGRFVPYEENVATKLEEEYKTAFESNNWHRKVELANGDTVVYHGPDVLVLFPPSRSPDPWGTTPNQTRPRIVKRGMDEFDIDEGEPAKVDHLLFMVHGIGSVCDLKFRTVEEVVDEFRSMAFQLVQSHYKSSVESGLVNRVEVLPVSWHGKLHSEETGIDDQLKRITLESIPKLRHFTNDTILDVLFYTSPVYCQTIVSSVGNELNRIYDLFKSRNPSFDGAVSLGGHSLGSLIIFDLLTHQQPEPVQQMTSDGDIASTKDDNTKTPTRKISRRISYMMGVAGTGHPQIDYPILHFYPKAFFALGSPIGMFVTVRGLDKLGDQFALPTCPAFYNIFHPYDPVAYRVEALVNPDLAKLKPVLIPHHKGRKRMHLELKETMTKVGADLKNKLFGSVKNTLNTFYQLAFLKQSQPSLEEEIKKEIETQLETPPIMDEQEPQQEETDLPLGTLNKGRRIDYVLQEAPFEFFNEYIFALTSHVCYWDSEDTMLLILKEIYGNMNVETDNKIPQQTMTIERPPVSPSPKVDYKIVDPTCPIQPNDNLQPPPTTGFVRKT